jgi:hypothetical protein
MMVTHFLASTYDASSLPIPGINHAVAKGDRECEIPVAGGGSPKPWIEFARDSPLEGGVSCELVSENAKFPASRENTGNFIDSGLGGASEAAKKGMKSVSYGPIPYAS